MGASVPNVCKICGVTDRDAPFYSGVSSRCKECHKAKTRENRAANVEYYRAYDAKRYQQDPRVKERHNRYALTDAGKSSLAKARKKWQEANQEKRAAHVILGNAVRDARVSKPKECQGCGARGMIHGHHHDYARPLEVEWLCPKCHRQRHNH